MAIDDRQDPMWMKAVLWAAAIYNVAFAVWAVVWPNAWFDLSSMPRPTYPQIWQCVGMIVGVYGVGYGIAALSPTRWWPIVLVGLLGKVLGPIGFAMAILQDQFPLSMAWIIVCNDLIRWVPFVVILLHRLKAHRRVQARSQASAGATDAGAS